MNSHDLSIIESIRTHTLKQLGGAIAPGSPVALVDVPGHGNVGDLMIFAGELAYLREMNADVRYMSDIRRFDVEILRRRMPSGLVLIHGGGNLGDIWPEHQAFKEYLARELHDYPLVQLPQTAYFASPVSAEVAEQAFTSHPEFTLMIRDNESWVRSEKYFPGVVKLLVPDMAFGWTPKRVSGGSVENSGTLVLARTDREGTSGLASAIASRLGTSDRIVDWEMNRLERLMFRAGKAPGKITNGPLENYLRRLLYHGTSAGLRLSAQANLKAGVRTFHGSALVVTDRLHAHILASLMGIPNIAMDNSYGKVRALYHDYTSGLTTSHFAEDVGQLHALYDSMSASASN